jgi:tetratricopeptide (TPR) repeat protein
LHSRFNHSFSQLRVLTDKGGECVVNYVLAQLTELLLALAAGEEAPAIAQLHTLLLRRLETRGVRGTAEAVEQWCRRTAKVFGVASYALETKTEFALVDTNEVEWSADKLFTQVGVETVDGSGGASTFRAASDGVYARYGFRFCSSKEVTESNAGGEFVEVDAKMAQVRVAALLGKEDVQRALLSLKVISTVPADVQREVENLEKAQLKVTALLDARVAEVEQATRENAGKIAGNKTDIAGMQRRMSELAKRGVVDARGIWANLRPPPKAFTGRRAEVDAVKTMLQKERGLLTLIGDGGEGKSSVVYKALDELLSMADDGDGGAVEQLAADALSLEECYPDGMLWIDFNQSERILDACVTVVRRFGGAVRGAKEECARILGQKQLLLVLDSTEQIRSDASAGALELRYLIEMQGRATIVVTTRHEGDEHGEVVRLQELSAEDAQTLYHKIHVKSSDVAARTEILALMSGVPLAIELAASFLNKRTNKSEKTFAAELHKRGLKALSKRNASTRQDSVDALMAGSVAAVGALALSVLSLLGRLAFAPVTIDVCAAALAVDETTAEDALEELCEYSLVRRIAEIEGGYRLAHGLVHVYCASADMVALTVDAAVPLLDLFAAAVKGDAKGVLAVDEVRVHVAWLVQRADTHWLQVVALAKALLAYFASRGTQGQGLAVGKKLVHAQHELGDRIGEVLAVNAYAYALQGIGRLNEAVVEYERALALIDDTSDVKEDRQAKAAVLRMLGSAYLLQGSFDKAECMMLDGLAIEEELLDAKSPALAASYNNLGSLYHSRGELDKAEEYYLKCVAIREEVLDAKSPDLAALYNNLGALYSNKGELDKAEEYYLKGLAIKDEVLDAKSPSLAASYNNLGRLYSDKGELDKAEEYYLKCVASQEEVLDAKSPSLAMSYNNLA